MEPDVVEIAPLMASNSKTRKQKEVAIPDVIDVEQYELHNNAASTFNKTADKKNKGKAVHVGSYSYNDQVKETAVDASCPAIKMESHPGMSPGSHNLLDPESLIYEDDYDSPDQYPYEIMDVDEYSIFQDLLDSKDIPTDVEVSMPWFSNSTHEETKKLGGSSSSQASNGKKSDVANGHGSSTSLFPWPQIPTSFAHPWNFFTQTSKGSKWSPTSSPQNTQVIYSPASPFPADCTTAKAWNPFAGSSNNGGVIINTFGVMPPQSHGMVMAAPPSGIVPPVPPNPPNSHASANLPPRVEEVLSAQDSSRAQKNVEDFLGKFVFFKKFDTVDDYSDHHYASKGSISKQRSKSWAKKIQEEWKILENDLPDTIFVRVYESRMDLLRAVIIGAEGTPYHDGLFFFDVFFPDSYPNVPPQVHYHSGGLRINPNLYNCGKVCLSLLGTWSGSHREKWIPNVSTMLQVLVSIQALILNQKPYFNEPGYERTMGTPSGESNSNAYSENTFILSLKTMIYNMRRPPKHFEDFAYGHFFSRAHDILKACKAYKEGAPVGSLVTGGVQDVEESSQSSSKKFRSEVSNFVKPLVKEFTLLGVKDADKALENNANAENNKANNPKRDRESS